LRFALQPRVSLILTKKFCPVGLATAVCAKGYTEISLIAAVIVLGCCSFETDCGIFQLYLALLIARTVFSKLCIHRYTLTGNDSPHH